METNLTSLSKFLAVVESDHTHDRAKELAFAILAADANDAATLRWLAACAVVRAEEIDPS